jgi:hypothetical protein
LASKFSQAPFGAMVFPMKVRAKVIADDIVNTRIMTWAKFDVPVHIPACQRLASLRKNSAFSFLPL